MNENFARFLKAVQIYELIQDKTPGLLPEITAKAAEHLAGETLAAIFTVDSYDRFLPQSGIDFFNAVLGDIHYAVNQYRQQHPEIPAREMPFMPPLFKQILSDRERTFSVGGFQKDEEVYQELQGFSDEILHGELFGEHDKDLFLALQDTLNSLSETSDLCVNAGELDRIAQKTTGSWNSLRDAMTAYAENQFKTQKDRENYCKNDFFRFAELAKWKIVKFSADGTAVPVNFCDFWNGDSARELFEQERKCRSEFRAVLEKAHPLREDKDTVETIKGYLDTVMEIFHLLKPLQLNGEAGGDPGLLAILSELHARFGKLIPLYNHVRNYVTRKPEDAAKIKLMFNKPTLADGWDNNKEKENHTVIFRKGSSFYLGIVAPQAKIDFENIPGTQEGPLLQKMVYKLLPGPNKMLPKVFFSKKNIAFFAPSPQLLQNYKANKHLKGDTFDLSFCHELIDFFKRSIAKHPDWSTFGFHFSQTSDYEGIDEFYREVAEQGYSITFSDVPEAYLWKLVDEGKLFLFQIWNKDFSEHSTGTPNKFTLYWKALFDPDNLSDVVFKLNGEAELFWRKPVVPKKVTHPAGEKVVNRTIVTDVVGDKARRDPIPESVHSELFRWQNGKLAESDLSGETREFLKRYPVLFWEKGMPITNAVRRTVVKAAPFDLIKDRRYTEDKYSFHVPITINFKAPSKPGKFNDNVLEYLRRHPDVKIIGLDRGENNLIYLVLIDRQGRILRQESLNLVDGTDYRSKLDQREKERDEARKSWSAIGKIKDLKAGYLSQVVYEIARTMVRENAIVVMEDLNFGFKRSRMKIEKQVYQKFEKALIDKLNYLVFKDTEELRTPGGVLNGYQLTDKFAGFNKLGKQCGFLFYVPAGFTSRIDPSTGFADLFSTRECTGAESIKNFFARFDAIGYDARRDAFSFTFDYKKFTVKQKIDHSRWTIWSLPEAWRNEKDRKSGKFVPVKHAPTQEIKSALKVAGIHLEDGLDLFKVLRETPADKAHAPFFHAIFDAFKLTTALRHKSAAGDRIISPVLNDKEEFFDSSRSGNAMPQDADANGAYHIALKGLYLLQHDISEGKKPGKLDNAAWLDFARQRNHR